MTLNLNGELLRLDRAAVMGILNVTPDSFYSGNRATAGDLRRRIESMIGSGADMIDIGGYSTRPGASEVSVEEELERVLEAVRLIRSEFSRQIPISVDTFRAEVAEESVKAGADIVNDVSGGDLDPEMFATVARLGVPYILMHMRGTPATMQGLTDYDDVTADVLREMASKVDTLRQMGVADVIVDPGFGFAKSLDQNYRLLGELRAFKALGCPVLAGLSRKSMIFRELSITPEEALNGTTALNMLALANGADILRVHDVKEAVETVRLYEAYRRNLPEERRCILVTDRETGYETPAIY